MMKQRILIAEDDAAILTPGSPTSWKERAFPWTRPRTARKRS